MENYPFLKEMGREQNLPSTEHDQAWREFVEKYPLEKLAKVALEHINSYLESEDGDATDLESATEIIEAIRDRARKER